MNAPRKNLTGLLIAVAVAGGCDSEASPVAPGAVEEAVFAVPISVEDLEHDIATGSVRLEVKLRTASAPLVAREVEVEAPEDLADEEQIESRISAVVAAGAGAVITLELGGLEVEVGPSTSFHDERSGAESRLADFLERVQSELAAGRRPAIEAKRPPPATPQDPGDASFFATKVRLNDESSEPEIEINVDSDNLQALGPGNGVLRILGLEIEIDIAGGRTEVERETEDATGEIDFESLVASVDLGARSVTLHSGTVVRIVAGTDIEQDSGNDDRHLRSLAEVADAVAAGLVVEAEGEGVLEGPGVIIAIEIEFEVEDDGDDIPGAIEFEGRVQSVNTEAATFTLAGGLILTVAAGTRFDGDGDLHDLSSTAAAVGQGLPVRAEGDAVASADGTGLVAIEVKIEVDD